MKTTLVLIIAMVMCLQSFADPKPRKRHADFKYGDLRGVVYKKTVRPLVIKHIWISIVIGTIMGPVIVEEIHKLKTSRN